MSEMAIFRQSDGLVGCRRREAHEHKNHDLARHRREKKRLPSVLGTCGTNTRRCCSTAVIGDLWLVRDVYKPRTTPNCVLYLRHALAVEPQYPVTHQLHFSTRWRNLNHLAITASVNPSTYFNLLTNPQCLRVHYCRLVHEIERASC